MPHRQHMKANRLLDHRPHKIDQLKQPPYIFVRNINGTRNEIIGPGSMWKQNDIMKRYKTHGKKAGFIHKPFGIGDVFVHYFSGDILILRKTTFKKGVNYPFFEKAVSQQIEKMHKYIQVVERDLRWRKGSYCESERRKNWKPADYRYTSNKEAERREKDKAYHREYYRKYYQKKKAQKGENI